MANEAVKFVWEGAIPLQINLHKSDVASHPALVLAPRIGYLPLLVRSSYKALFQGFTSSWFDYKGFPLKWYIPTGVLFDLLCAEPERPWNLTAAYIINGNCKNVMNMSQSDQEDLWTSFMNGTNGQC